MRPPLPTLLLTLLLPATLAPAQSSWSRFRGPAGQGIGPSAGLPATFTEANVRWRVPVGGKGHSSPVLWRDRLFLTREGAAPGERDVACFATASGEQVWATGCHFEPHAQHAFNSFASSTPAVDDSGVYVVWSSAAELQAVAFDADGGLRWQRRLGAFSAQHGSGSSPILFEDLLIVANENEGDESFVAALDKQTGERRWTLPRRSVAQRGSYATPIVVQWHDDPLLLLASSAHGLSAVAPRDGRLLWEVDLALTTRCVAGPCVSGDRVLVLAGTGGGGKEAAVVRLPQADQPASVLYRPRRNLPYVPNGLALQGRFYLFADGGTASCLDAGSGDVLWRERLAGTFFSSPVSNGETVYVASREGELFSLAAGERFELLGSFDLGAPVFATPAIGGGSLFVRTAAELICLGGAPATTGPATWTRFRGPNGTGVADTAGLPVRFGPDENVVWKTALPLGHSSPVLSRTHVFVTAVDGERLETICLQRADGRIAWRAEAPRARTTKVDARNNAASPTPAIDTDTVVVFFPDFGLLAYDHAGQERWRLPLGPFENLYGMGASPVIDGDRVFLACDQNRGSFVLAAALADGKELWRTPRPRATSGHCTPILFDADDGARQLVLPGSFLLDAYDTHSGERAWWVRGLSFEMKSVPVLHRGTIYINGYGSPLNQPGTEIVLPPFAEALAVNDADHDGAISRSEVPERRARSFFEAIDLDADGTLGQSEWEYLRDALASRNGLLAIKAGGKGDMTEPNTLWSYRRSVPQLPSTLVYHDVLYMLADQGGLLTTLRPASGEVIERGRLDRAVDNYYASPVAGDDKVYLVSEGGLVSVLPAGGSLEPLATNDLDEACYATPALADGRIYLRTQGALYCFGVH